MANIRWEEEMSKEMKKLLITGSQGQLGRALNKVINENKELKRKYTIVNTDHAPDIADTVLPLDIRSQEGIISLFTTVKPDIIINCASMTAVDLCESEQEAAYEINALGPKNLALAAKEIGARLVHVSTDYVFDGKGNRPYIESDKTGPESIYGKTKLQGEEFVREILDKHFIVRTAWLYGQGKNFINTMIKLSETHKEIKVVGDQQGSPTSAIELAKVIVLIMESKEYGIYHATAEGSTTWYDFAVKVFELTQKEVLVKKIKTSEYPTPAKRPMYSVLENKALQDNFGYKMQEWDKVLESYLTVDFYE